MTAQIIDRSVLEDFHDILEPCDVARLLDAFVRELQVTPGVIGDHVAAGNIGAARLRAHYLKGAALAIGACELADCADRIEIAPEADIAMLVDRLAWCAARTSEAIGDIRAAADTA